MSVRLLHGLILGAVAAAGLLAVAASGDDAKPPPTVSLTAADYSFLRA